MSAPVAKPKAFEAGPTLASNSRFEVRAARGAGDVAAAQRLRYQVFYEEMTARPSAAMARVRRDFDEFDEICDHLLVIDRHGPTGERTVATTRVLRGEVAEAHGGFYCAREFDIRSLVRAGTAGVCEIGRSSVHPDYRGNAIIQLLWRGLARYYQTHRISYVIGCASFPGEDPSEHAHALAYLFDQHLAPLERRARAWPHLYTPMECLRGEAPTARRIWGCLPPLIKGYLRLGAVVGDGAVVDAQFQTTDVFMAVDLAQAPERYHAFFERGSVHGRPETVTA